MLDPTIKAAMVALVFAVLKVLVAGFPQFPIDDALLNTIAVAFVGWLLSLLGYGLVLRVLPSLTAKWRQKGLLPPENTY